MDMAILVGVESAYSPSAPYAESARGVQAASEPASNTGLPKWDDTVEVAGGYARLRMRQEEANALAMEIRGGKVSSVELRKLYPPYPPEQERRMAYLDQIPGLQRQIEALRYPATPMEVASGEVERLVHDLSKNSRWQLAHLGASGAISTQRGILEGVARQESIESRRAA
jgi:hypothetical protein